MIIVKKTAVLSPRGARGVSGVARFECFKDKSDVKVNLAGGHKDLYAVVAVGDEKRVVKLSGDRIYLTRADLSGDCAVIVADGEKRVLCAGATACGYDYAQLEEFLRTSLGNGNFADKDGGRGEIEVREKPAAVKQTEAAEKEDMTMTAAQEQNVAETFDTTVEKEEKDADGQDPVSAKSEETQIETEEKKAENAKQVAENDEEIKENTESEAQDVGVSDDKDGGKRKTRFFDKIADKIETLFGQNEKEEELTALIPDSRWVRVRTEDGWYVVGIVGEPAEFICYGIPADNASDPPEEDEGCRQWLEVERGGRGYWMMYQSAESGETLTAI